MKNKIFICGLLTAATGFGIILYNKLNKCMMEITDLSNKTDKFKKYYNILNQWMLLKQEGKSLLSYFDYNNYKTVAIYGMGEMGNRLYEELKNNNIIELKYAIDKNASSTYSELEVKDVEDILEDVDVIVVTAVYDFDKIKEDLKKIINITADIVSLEDIVYEI